MIELSLLERGLTSVSKPSKPLLSLDARGSLANSLTFSRHSGQSIARSKPTPSLALTLPIQYQRWLYQDYLYQWSKLSQADRLFWRNYGSRHHLPATAAFLQDRLKTLPDIVALWHLDTHSGTIQHDYSKNGNDLTVFGAIPTTGLIDGAMLFDGVDDRLTAAYSSSLDFNTQFTLELFIKFHTLKTCGPTGNFTSLGGLNRGGHGLSMKVNVFHFRVGVNNTFFDEVLGSPKLTETWYCVHGIHDGSFLHLYVNNVLDAAPVAATQYPFNKSAGGYNLGRSWEAFSHCTIDHCIIYNRCLDSTERQIHSERRYQE